MCNIFILLQAKEKPIRGPQLGSQFQFPFQSLQKYDICVNKSMKRFSRFVCKVLFFLCEDINALTNTNLLIYQGIEVSLWVLSKPKRNYCLIYLMQLQILQPAKRICSDNPHRTDCLSAHVPVSGETHHTFLKSQHPRQSSLLILQSPRYLPTPKRPGCCPESHSFSRGYAITEKHPQQGMLHMLGKVQCQISCLNSITLKI